ncbi:hypothetical protein BDZ85DRAFT_262072 [Elsinoe ampelina]|uniref:Uncharacterized protein n=1 Tax=Elsinoe ampelina TaxID=302913 RepID=A0A6A6GDG5_9PEZI|nr:hypothetical protein BDZ85DRAFT_262072 [Elsinoe ampelina]
MCGDSSKTSVGGTIAILKSDSGAAPDLNLLFQSQDASTIASICGSTQPLQGQDQAFDVQIHQDGDLRAANSPHNVLHNFSLRQCQSSGLFHLPFPINLGVGGDGIIGRRVRVEHRGVNGERIVRQGIIGWN